MLLAAGVAMAIVVAVAANSYLSSGPADTSRTASARVLVDTADSQLVNAAPRAADTLPIRALLLANLMASHEGKALVARDAGLRSSELVVFDPLADALPPVKTPLVTRAAALPLMAGVPNVLNVHADVDAPTISIQAHAPDAPRARALADAAVSGLESLVESHGDDGRGLLRVDAITPPRLTPSAAPAASRSVLVFAVAVVAFALWCAGVLAATSTGAHRRPASVTSDLLGPQEGNGTVGGRRYAASAAIDT
jgi:hypothetical protein